MFGEAEAVVVVVAIVDPMDGKAEQSAAEGCLVGCSPQHQMAAMACLLFVLLASVMIVLASRQSRAWFWPREMLGRISVVASALAPLRPPSLNWP